MQTQIVVVGAGMVGVCCALSLQRRGYAVTLIDRKAPGRETSYGNSGVLSRSSVFPINGPGLLRQLPRYVANRRPAVRWRASLLRRPAWIAQFLAQCTPAGTARRAQALNDLIALSMDLNRRLIAQAGLAHHVRETGWLKVWRQEHGADHARAEAAALSAFGIATQTLDDDGIATLEPAAARVFQAGLLIKDAASVDDPGAIVAGYAALFQRHGGALVRREVSGLFRTTTGWRLDAGDTTFDADEVVVALGPWSADLLRPLGYRIPLGFERGYHVHLAATDGAGPRRAVYDVEGGYVASPMRDGVRVTSGVELAARDAKPNTAQIEHAEQLARKTFGLGERVGATPWLGSRPTLPDSLPMIGPMPRARGLWAAFGHQHVGFSTGAATGEIIAAAIAGEPAPMDARAFAPARFTIAK